jgi:hypothetical protein
VVTLAFFLGEFCGSALVNAPATLLPHAGEGSVMFILAFILGKFRGNALEDGPDIVLSRAGKSSGG